MNSTSIPVSFFRYSPSGLNLRCSSVDDLSGLAETRNNPGPWAQEERRQASCSASAQAPRRVRRIAMAKGPVSGWKSGGAKSREHVAALRREEVSIRRMMQPQLRGERAAAQLPMIAEPRPRVVGVRPRGEPGVGEEGVGGPFPDAAAPAQARIPGSAFPFRGARQ